MNQTPFDLPLKLVTNALIRDSHGICILGDSSARCTPEQAAYIVRAVNSHAALREALRSMITLANATIQYDENDEVKRAAGVCLETAWLPAK